MTQRVTFSTVKAFSCQAVSFNEIRSLPKRAKERPVWKLLGGRQAEGGREDVVCGCMPWVDEEGGGERRGRRGGGLK